MKTPLLSVVMLSYNAEKFLTKAIDSALSQDFEDFELIIIDDGSGDRSVDLIRSYRDTRIKLYLNNVNRGIVYSRNKGISLSSGKYIGMLDSDDIALPGKFRKQIEFLESHPEFGMIGSWAKLIDTNGKVLKDVWKVRARPDKIPAIMLFKNYFIQSAVVFRRDLFDCPFYKEGYEIVEDYKLWIDIMKISKAWNLPEYLVEYRVHEKNITKTGKSTVRENLIAVYTELLGELNISPSPADIEIHHRIREGEKITSRQAFLENAHWLLYLLNQNINTKKYSRKAFAQILANRWLKILWMSRSLAFLPVFSLVNLKFAREFLISRIAKSYA